MQIIKKSLFATFSFVLISCLAWALTPGARHVQSNSVWTITKGPITGKKIFDSGEEAAISIEGKIDPPLGPTNFGNVSSVVTKQCSSTPTSLPPGDYAGGANGAAFTLDVKRASLPTDCKAVVVTYTMGDGTEQSLCFANPRYRKVAAFVFPVLGSSPSFTQGSFINPTVHILDAEGDLDPDFNGTVRVTTSSLNGSRVKIDGYFGTGVVQIVDGVGLLEIECVLAIPGDTLIFDLTAPGGRINGCRSSIEVQ